MNRLWVLTLGLVALTAVQGCKRKEPQPIPGPKAGSMVFMHATPGIAWFQGSLDEAFARTKRHMSCREHTLAAPRTSELARTRKWLSTPTPAICAPGACPAGPQPRHRLV
jgi:hypothetical protein